LDGEISTKLKWVLRKNSEFVSGMPVPNKFTRQRIQNRCKNHSKAKCHTLACNPRNPEGETSLPEIDENEAINIEPTDEIKNKIDEKTRLKLPPEILEYLETRVMKKHTWVEIIDGKLFCQVNLTTASVVKFKASFRILTINLISFQKFDFINEIRNLISFQKFDFISEI